MNPNLRGQRISREDLINESQEVLLKSGIGNHSRAQLLAEVSKEIVGSQNPMFCQLQPKIHSHENESWIKAFSLIFQYLLEHELQTTVNCIESEFNQGKLPKELTDLSQVEIDGKFEQLLRASSPAPLKSFQERVDQYMDDVQKHDLEIANNQRKNNQSTSSTRKVTPRSTPHTNIADSSANQRSQKSRSSRKVSAKHTPQTGYSKASSVSKSANKSDHKVKSSASRTQSKKAPIEDSDLIDDFIIEEVILPRD